MDAETAKMTPEEKSLLDIIFAGVVLNIVWLFGVLLALLKIK